MRENFTNFASATLNGSMTAASNTLTVNAGQGAYFPNTNGTGFYITIDSEIIFVAGRIGSGDTFNGLVRGLDGTTATSHIGGSAIVQLAICAQNMVHLWQNVADTFTPEVPPVQLVTNNAPVNLGSTYVYDSEFEGTFAWTLYPGAGSGTTWSIASTMKSHLLFSRGTGDNGLYTAYEPFTPTANTAFTVTCKVQDAGSFLNQQSDNTLLHFFVSDQSNPTAGTGTGNRFRVSMSTTTSVADRLTFVTLFQNGSPNSGSTSFSYPLFLPYFLRITYDGAGTWSGYVGNGVTYALLAQYTLSFTPQSLGFQFATTSNSGRFVMQTAAIDYVRVVQGTALPPFGYFGEH